MQGRRRDPDTKPWDLEPGDYMLAADGVPWVTLPSGVGPSRLDGWQVTEHDDETITVSPSIFDAPNGWHGWLERGVWRSV